MSCSKRIQSLKLLSNCYQNCFAVYASRQYTAVTCIRIQNYAWLSLSKYTVSEKSSLSELCNFADFQNVCIAGKRMKFTIKPIRHYPPHLRHVATLPWEIKKSFFADIQQIWKKMQTNFIFSVFKIACLSPYWLQINIFNVTVLLLIYFCDQFVAPEIRHSRRHCSVCQQSTWYLATRTRFW